jgi:hypothetical protein
LVGLLRFWLVSLLVTFWAKPNLSNKRESHNELLFSGGMNQKCEYNRRAARFPWVNIEAWRVITFQVICAQL